MMISEINIAENSGITCNNCDACCCREKVFILSDTGVPDYLIEIDKWEGQTMARLDDGWCAALDRNTMMCMIYEKRPMICRELVMGEEECISIREHSF